MLQAASISWTVECHVKSCLYRVSYNQEKINSASYLPFNNLESNYDIKTLYSGCNVTSPVVRYNYVTCTKKKHIFCNKRSQFCSSELTYRPILQPCDILGSLASIHLLAAVNSAVEFQHFLFLFFFCERRSVFGPPLRRYNNPQQLKTRFRFARDFICKTTTVSKLANRLTFCDPSG